MTAGPERPPTTLADVVAVFQRSLHAPDPGALFVVLATVVGNRVSNDPIWTMLIGAPSSGKTEMVEAVDDLPEVHSVSTTTKAGLLTGTTIDGGTGGLLNELGDRGLIVFKDLTTLLSEGASTRTEVLGIMRELYDGKYVRMVGSGGGREIRWKGHVGCIGCVTPAVDDIDMGAFGERWLRYRLPPLVGADRFISGLVAYRERSNQRANRTARRQVVSALFADLVLPDVLPGLTSAEEDRLITVAEIATTCRGSVKRDGAHRDNISLVLPPEELPRMVIALGQLSGALTVIGVDDDTRWHLLVKIALDGMHDMRRKVLGVLLPASADFTTSTIGGRCGLPATTTRRHLEDLTALGVVTRTGERPERWAISSWLRQRWWAVDGFEGVPDGA